MISVMIVDDEPFIREGLKVVINWEEQGFHIVEEATNGQEALEILENTSIDLVIADIRMPIFSGLEMIEEAKKKLNTNTKFVILSGYSDFEYVRKALNQNVTDYILKPIQKDELISTLKRVKDEILKEQLNEQEIQQLKNNQLKNSIEGLIGGLYTEASLCLIRDNFGVIHTLRYVLLRIVCKDSTRATGALRLHVEELLTEQVNGMDYYLTESKKVNANTYDLGLILYSKVRKVRDLELIEKIFEITQSDLELQYSFYVGKQVEELEKLSESYKSAMKVTVNQCMSNTKDQITYFDDMKAKESTRHTVSYEKIERLTQYVKEHNIEQITPVIKSIYEELKEGLVEPELIQINIRYILYNLVDISQNLLETTEEEELLENLNNTMIEDVSYCSDMEAFIHVVIDLAEYLYQLKNGSASNVLSKIIKEIDEHYAENLSLKELGKRYYVNSVYLGQVFKKEIGKSFKDYLNMVRIEKAACLLTESDERVYTIAEKVGYQKVDYFINKFVCIKGTTPHQYRIKAKKV